MSNAHTACAIMNFFCFLGFVTVIVVIISRAPDGGHHAKRLGRALAFVRVI
jgi:hypothetical protein